MLQDRKIILKKCILYIPAKSLQCLSPAELPQKIPAFLLLRKDISFPDELMISLYENACVFAA